MIETQNWTPAPRPQVAGDFDQVRATVQALQGAASLLQGAMEQREGLWSDMRNAEQKLGVIENQRTRAEYTLAATSAQLERTSRQLDEVRTEHSGVLLEFDRLVAGALARRSAVLAEISELERRRDGLAVTVAESAARVPEVVHFDPEIVIEPTVYETLVATAAAEEPGSVSAENLALDPTADVGPSGGNVQSRETLGAAAAAEGATVVDDGLFEVPEVPSHTGIEVARAEAPAKGASRWRALATVLLGALLIGLAVLLTPLTQVFGGLQLLAVTSGSMVPTIQVGGIVGVLPTPATELQAGDVITFTNQSNPDALVTHRIVSIEERGGQELLTTRGDANDSADAVAVPATRAVGRVWFTAPWLGYAMVWLASPLARIGILAVSVLGLTLPNFKKKPRGEPETTYTALEREIESLLPASVKQ